MEQLVVFVSPELRGEKAGKGSSHERGEVGDL
jgi:hypothetical protein